MIENLFKNEVLHVDSEALALEDFSDDVGALVVLGKEQNLAL